MAITGEIKQTTVSFSDFEKYENQIVTVKGTIHNIRMMSDFAFVILRTARETIQCVYAESFSDYRMSEDVKEECAVKITGKVVAGETRDGSKRYELQIHDIVVLSHPADIPPVVITKKQVNCDLSTKLDYRPVTLRNPKERAIFKLQEVIARGFREFLTAQGFTEIRSPKINFAGAEGGTNVFKLDYFGKEVYLAQSPQLYKQALVGVFGKVYDVGPVFRAEHHDTSRHLNEYMSMDFEMGFIDSFEDIMNMEVGILKYIMNLLKTEYQNEV
jgi:nondiscriminating aspartyl-tRNA synthetase